MPHSDFNDLHVLKGVDAVRHQIMSALEQGPANEAAPPAPTTEGGEGNRLGLDDALKRFALVFGETKIYDFRSRQVLKKTAVQDLIGREVFKAWLDSDSRRTVTWQDINGWKAEVDKGDPRAKILERFVYVYPTKNAWDCKRQDLVPLEALKVLMPTEYTWWLEHRERRVIEQDQLVFDPTQTSDPKSTINTFTGLPLSPDKNTNKCENILKLLSWLCNEDQDIVHWVLCWLAYPLQNVGSKLDTALLFHSDVQGSGKSLFFGQVMTAIYGRYASVLGQHQLESQYTDWRSRLLYAVFEEVLSRTEKHNQMGTIKHMITGTTQRIERKFVTGWEEANHMNGVFLSNEIQPFPLEPSDRRFMVVWPKKTLPEDLQTLVSWELDHDGPAAFYQYLLLYDTRDFGPHTKPLTTRAKERIIEFSLPNFEVFWSAWKNGELDAPFGVCMTRDLYRVYQQWCKASGNRPMTETKLITILASRVHKERKHYRHSGVKRLGTFFIPDGCRCPSDTYEIDWLGEAVGSFRLQAFTAEEA